MSDRDEQQVPETQFEVGESSSGKKVLDPTGLWFDDSELSRSITDVFKSYFNAPWRNYSMVDAATRTQWFNLFKVECS